MRSLTATLHNPAASSQGNLLSAPLCLGLTASTHIPTYTATHPPLQTALLLQVIQILVARDKETHQPKGSAYVWFQRRRESELALKRLNGSTTAMPDPAAPQAKPLMVTLAQHSVAPVRAYRVGWGDHRQEA